ncbi:MAG TPA: YggS family pyridoxal phosphate-dependent enzyme [Prosthecobacter sp.]|nr:YggS family pyridoxal phosphate-dependent enzyme [Prosthecobacter sp.]
MSDLAERLQNIRDRITAAAQRAGRDPASVQLLAVSKTQPVEAILEAVAAGQLLFGENRVQELMTKQSMVPAKARWHLIGPLQSNKVRKVLPLADVIHSVDSLDIAKDINRIAAELGLYPKVYLEINLAAESTKHGFTARVIREQLDSLYELDRLYIQGVMCIPPFDPQPEKSRPFFVQLRELRDELEKLGGAPLPQLSMGMSHDFEVAIEEGATIVRVGSAIFGERKKKGAP